MTSRGAEATEERTGDVPGSGAAGDVLAVLAVFLLAGLVAGVLWWVLVDPAVYVKVRGSGSMNEVQLNKRFNADGWYVVIAAVGGSCCGMLLTWWRSRNPVLTTCLLVLGAAVAAAVTAVVGYQLGPGDPDAALAAAAPGESVPLQLEVTATAAYLVWPMAALVGALLVLWSVPPPPDPQGSSVPQQ